MRSKNVSVTSNPLRRDYQVLTANGGQSALQVKSQTVHDSWLVIHTQNTR